MSATCVIKKLFHSFFCAVEGMKSAWEQEQSFRLEIFLCALLLPVVMTLSASRLEKLMLVLLMLLLLVIELVNSAVEALVDRISPEIHPLSRLAKDASCAAVGLVLLMNIIAWCCVLS